MVQLRILSGKRAGVAWAARRFPVRIGRASTADLQLDESGVWDQHVRIELDRTEGFILTARSEAPATVNGQPVQRALLRSGDMIEMGSLKLQFWLDAVRQTRLGLREWLTWIGIGMVPLGQAWLIWRLWG